MNMLTEERQQAILLMLNEKEIVKTKELMGQFDVSESTIRRDLQEMEEKNLLKRVHGGAKSILKLEPELNMLEKSVKNVHQKKEIASYAASLVHDGDFIYLDAGTTTYEMLPFLKGKNVHVVTNSVYHASTGIDLGIQMTMIGGTVRMTTKASVSSQAIEQLQTYYFDKAFMGVNGIHADYGFTTVDAEEAATKKAAMNQAQHVFVLTDHSKFGKVNFSKIADVETGIIITDQIEENDVLDRLKTKTTIKEVL